MIALKAASTNSCAERKENIFFPFTNEIIPFNLAGQPVTPRWMMIHVIGAVVIRMRRTGEDKNI